MNVIRYQPFRAEKWISYCVFAIGIMSFVGVGYCVPKLNFSFFFLLCMGVSAIFLTKYLYNTSKAIILFETECLRIFEGKNSQYHCVLLKDLSYAYYATNFKGHLFLVLSNKPLAEIHAKRFANQGSCSSKLLIANTVVIYIDAQQQLEQIKGWVDHSILHINVYCQD